MISLGDEIMFKKIFSEYYLDKDMKKIYSSIQLNSSYHLEKVWLVCKNYNESGAVFVFENKNEVIVFYSDFDEYILCQKKYTHEEYDNIDFEEILNVLVINKCLSKSKVFNGADDFLAEIINETKNHIQYLLKYFKNDEAISELRKKSLSFNVSYSCVFFCLYTAFGFEQAVRPNFFIRYKICDNDQNVLAYYDAEFTQDFSYSDDYIIIV